MGELPKRLREWGSRLRGMKNNKILLTLILMLGMGLFFYSFPEKSALAEQTFRSMEISAEIIDPLSRIGKGIVKENKPVRNATQSDAGGDQKNIPILEKVEKKELKQEPNLLEKEILALVSGYPIENMASYISEQKKIVAAFLVAIARKESSWGEHVPTKNGKDCYNYWGFKGPQNPTEGGYSCFESREEAVAVVGARIQKLVEQGLDTPEKMLVWKCGSSCATHDPQGVRKWVSDVEAYFRKLI